MSQNGARLDPCKALVAHASRVLIDPLGRELAGQVEWLPLPDLPAEWPVAVVGKGPPVLLLHGFDSSFLEFRRLVPLLADHYQMFVPDLFGFGFCARLVPPVANPEAVLQHLERLVAAITKRNPEPLGLIGASMGGAVAVELARRVPKAINRLLLLAPAGLTGKPMPLPPVLDRLGVGFLSLPGVRQGLCRSAFANPDRDVGPAELQIASLHLEAPGWADTLATFARSGGFAGSGTPLPELPITVLWGANDRILRPAQKRAALALLGERVRELDDCGHLPHIDRPQAVAATWLAG